VEDWSASSLRSFGDITPNEEKFVGLGYGVREWLEDDDVPAGLSNQFPSPRDRHREARAADTGIRPALDPYPQDLLKALTAKN